jgi:DedD protein
MLNRNTSEDLLQLKKRARRRLVGAITLVVFALIVLWTALDSTPPRNIAGSNSIEIISSSPALLQPVVKAAPEVASVDTAEVPVVLTPQPELDPPLQESTPIPAPQYRASSSTQSVLPGKLVSHQKKVVVTPVPTPKPTPIAVADPQKILDGLDTTASKSAAPTEKTLRDKRYFIQIGAYADGDKAAQVVRKLKAEGIPAYSEKVTTEKGALMRVRVGPVKDEAKAQSYLKKMGVLGLSGHLSSK